MHCLYQGDHLVITVGKLRLTASTRLCVACESSSRRNRNKIDISLWTFYTTNNAVICSHGSTIGNPEGVQQMQEFTSLLEFMTRFSACRSRAAAQAHVCFIVPTRRRDPLCPACSMLISEANFMLQKLEHRDRMPWLAMTTGIWKLLSWARSLI